MLIFVRPAILHAQSVLELKQTNALSVLTSATLSKMDTAQKKDPATQVSI